MANVAILRLPVWHWKGYKVSIFHIGRLISHRLYYFNERLVGTYWPSIYWMWLCGTGDLLGDTVGNLFAWHAINLGYKPGSGHVKLFVWDTLWLTLGSAVNFSLDKISVTLRWKILQLQTCRGYSSGGYGCASRSYVLTLSLLLLYTSLGGRVGNMLTWHGNNPGSSLVREIHSDSDYHYYYYYYNGCPVSLSPIPSGM